MIPTTGPDRPRRPLPGWPVAPPTIDELPPPPDPGPWVAGSALPPPPAGWTSGPPPAPAEPPGPGVSLQNLLLGLGTALVAVAAVVFTAVNWDRMGATVQALFLVGATLVAATAAATCARRRLPATAEALGVVALLLALVDVHVFRVGLFPSVDLASVWAGGLAVVALGGWSFGAATSIRSTRIVAAVVGQVPVLLVLAASDASATVAGIVALAQVAVVATAASRGVHLLRPARVAGAAAAALTAWIVSGQAVVLAAFESGADRRGPASVLLVAAAVAALVAWLRGDDEGLRSSALGASTLLGLAGFAGLAATAVPSASLVAVVGLAAALVFAIGLRADPRWGRVPAAVGATTALVASAPLVGVASAALVAASEVLPRAWDLDLALRASSLQLDDGVVLPGGVVALHLAVVALLVVSAVPLVGRRLVAGAGAGFVLLACVVAPLVVPLSIGGAAAVALLTATGAVAAAVLLAERPGALVGGAGAATAPLGLALLWSAATPTLTLIAIGCTAGLALALAVAARDRSQVELAVVAGAVIVVAAGAFAGLLLLANGGTPGGCWVAAGAAASVVGLVGVVLLAAEVAAARGDRAVDLALSQALEVVGWSVHGVALAAVASLDDRPALSVALGVGVLAGGLHAVRPGRRAFGWVAAAHALPLVWLQLAQADVRAPEPYVLPVAAVLLVAGWVADRRAVADGTTLGSWLTLGPALVVAAAPSVALALTDPGLVRPLVVLAVAAVVLAAGALHGRRAPVDVGTAVVVLLGARQLGPVVGGLPGWATIGSAGALLLAVGATFEQRRRDLDGVRHRYAELV